MATRSAFGKLLINCYAVNFIHLYLPLPQVFNLQTALLFSSPIKYPNFVCLLLVTLPRSTLVAAWRSGNIVGRINEVTLRRARLVPRWVTVFGG